MVNSPSTVQTAASPFLAGESPVVGAASATRTHDCFGTGSGRKEGATSSNDGSNIFTDLLGGVLSNFSGGGNGLSGILSTVAGFIPGGNMMFAAVKTMFSKTN